MDKQIAQQIGMGVLVIAVGLSGWLLPYRWNVLRLRRSLARAVSEDTNKKVPKVLGTVLMLAGAAVLVATAIVGEL